MTFMMRTPLCLLLLAGACNAGRADTVNGSIEAHAWQPSGSNTASGQASQASLYSDIQLGPLTLDIAGHPFDPPQTSGAAASLSFFRPATADAGYHSYAAGYALSYTPTPYTKGASTAMQLSGSLRILPSDLARLFTLLPDDATLNFESRLTLDGNLLAETSGSGRASAGVSFSRTLDGQLAAGSIQLTGIDGADPLPLVTGALTGSTASHTYTSLELSLLMPAGTNFGWGTNQARGVTILSVMDFTETVDFTGHCPRPLGFCAFPPDYYSTPLTFSIDTSADIGDSQGALAIADLRNTMTFSFTVLDAQGQPTDIPVYFALTPVPEPASAWLWLLGLAALCLARSRRTLLDAAGLIQRVSVAGFNQSNTSLHETPNSVS